MPCSFLFRVSDLSGVVPLLGPSLSGSCPAIVGVSDMSCALVCCSELWLFPVGLVCWGSAGWCALLLLLGEYIWFHIALPCWASLTCLEQRPCGASPCQALAPPIWSSMTCLGRPLFWSLFVRLCRLEIPGRHLSTLLDGGLLGAPCCSVLGKPWSLRSLLDAH